MVYILHVSATLVAILRELRHKRWIYRDISSQSSVISRYIHQSVMHLPEDGHKSGRNM